MDRSALLLSGSFGMGHDVMAEACEVSLGKRGWSSSTMDSLKLMGNAASGIGERVFRTILSAPGAYDAFHFTQLRPGGILGRFAERASSKYAVPTLSAEIERRPVDLVISVFASGAAAASRVKQARGGFATAVFCTDVCPHSMWVQDSCDLFLVTSQASAGFVRRFSPAARIAIVPAPVRPQFYDAPTQADARAELEVPEGEPCVLLMSGAWGLGPLTEVADLLTANGIYTLAVAGNNAKLEAALRRLGDRRDRLRPFGFTDRIPTLMAASDVVITSSGDTCTEARVIGRELLLLDVVPGHGRENLQQELERGSAAVASLEPSLLLRSALSALDRAVPPTERVTRSAEAWETAFGAALASIGLAD
jgi:UDP-N-acetylglucosamine:LPS N-acetylglucosamine transferase